MRVRCKINGLIEQMVCVAFIAVLQVFSKSCFFLSLSAYLIGVNTVCAWIGLLFAPVYSESRGNTCLYVYWQ